MDQDKETQADNIAENVDEQATEQEQKSEDTANSGIVELPLKVTAEAISSEGGKTGEISATAEAIESNAAPLSMNQHPNDVKFKVSYSKGFKGEKPFKEGSIEVVSKESAAHFTKLGMGSVIK